MVVLVTKADHPPAVPSRTVVCHRCGADCWLSLYSGASTIALAQMLGDDRITCGDCFTAMLEEESLEQFP